jgi:Domain of unknown function (DUF4214)
MHAFLDGPEYRQRPVTPWQHVVILYQTILARHPDAIELEAGVRTLLERFNAVLLEFLRSREFRSLMPDCQDQRAVTMLVTRMHQQALNRTPVAFEVSELVDHIKTTCNIEGAVAAFFHSSEYLSLPRILAQHVTLLYRSLLAREADAAGLEAWVNELARQLQATEEAFLNGTEFQEHFRALYQ